MDRLTDGVYTAGKEGEKVQNDSQLPKVGGFGIFH